MYLEERLTTLETKIDNLTKLMLNNSLALNAEEPQVEELQVEEPQVEESRFTDSAAFSAAIKDLVRAKPSIKGQVKATLSENGYSVLADVTPSDFGAIYSQVEAL